MDRSSKLRYVVFQGVVLLLIISLFAGCGVLENPVSENTSASDEIVLSDSDETTEQTIKKILEEVDLDEDLREILMTKSENPPGTIFDRIDRGLNSGTLTREEAVLLKLTAAYFPDQLDEQYRVNVPDTTPIYSDYLRRDIQWIMNHFEELDRTLQERLRPFTLRPDDPDSFYNPANKSKKQSLLHKLGLRQVVYADEQQLDSIEFSVSGKPFAGTIYYDASAQTSDAIPMEQKVATMKEAVEKAWPMFKNLLQAEPVGKLRIYLTDLQIATSHQAGAAYYSQDKSSRQLLDFYIKVDWSLSGNELKSVTVHELFHIFQYHVMEEYEELEAWWLQEATAVWSEHYVYPLINREHGFLDVFFGSLDAQRIDKGGLLDYASYMFFFYLSERADNDGLIADIILTTKGYDVATYIMNTITDFPDIYAQFALWNWNAKPWKFYSDNGTFPALRPYGTALQKKILRDSEIVEEGVVLPPGAIAYQYYHVISNDTQRIKFDFSDMPWDGNLHIQALYKVGDQWMRRDCTDQDALVFCRNKPSENIKGVVLVFSNADIENPNLLSTNPQIYSKDPVQLAYEIDTTGQCPESISGYTKITETMTYRDGNATASMVIHYFSEDELEYDEEREAYVITKRTLTYTLSSDKEFPDTAVFGLGGNDTTGSGLLVETYDLRDAPIRYQRQKKGGGVLYSDPVTESDDWVEYNDTVLGAYSGDPLSITFQYLGARGGMDVLSDEIDERGFRGNRQARVSVDAKMDMETTIEFSYSFPR
jgi:hypothetical protein